MRRLITAEAIRTARGVAGDALLIGDGRVIASGRAADLRRADLPEEPWPGGVIVPGLRDAHLHPIPYALSLTRLNLNAAGDVDQVLTEMRAAGAGLPPGRPLIAIRLDDEQLIEHRLPTRQELDLAVDDRPVLAYRYCGHVAVANTRALETSGLGADARDPAGGMFDRDEFGIPNGILRETAIEPVATRLAELSPPPDPEAVLRALQGLTTLGVTSLGAILAVGTGPWCDTGNELQTMLEIAGSLPLKMTVLLIAGDPGEVDRAAVSLDGSGSRLTFLGIKEFADGSLGGHTAALSAPYADRPETRGTLRLDPETVRARARASLARGGRVAVHAIGDIANARVLDLFEGLRQEGADEAHLRVEHASLLTPELIARFAASGITASVQPAFMASEATWIHKRVGSSRSGHIYPLASLRSAGVPLAGGSDCPVEPPHPLWGMAAARDRAGLAPAAESLTSDEALGLFTDGAARAMGEPEPLAPGSPADFAVLDTDPVTASPDELRGARVLSTWIDGEVLSRPERPVIWQA